MIAVNKELAEKVKELVQQGKNVEAVSLVQKVMKCGLRNAKEYVDSIRDQQS